MEYPTQPRSRGLLTQVDLDETVAHENVTHGATSRKIEENKFISNANGINADNFDATTLQLLKNSSIHFYICVYWAIYFFRVTILTL